MTLSDLISRLEDEGLIFVEDGEISLNEDCEILMAHQPSWPLEFQIRDIALVEIDNCSVLYVVEGEQNGYLPEEVNEQIYW